MSSHPSISPTIGDNHLNRRPAPSHRRKDSGELDVFDATQYFSGLINDDVGYVDGVEPDKIVEEGITTRIAEEKSLLMPGGKNPPPRAAKPIKDKKCRQPSSPGGKLASFLNSFFNQTASKKKSKSNSFTIQTVLSLKGDDEEERIVGRKGKCNISHSQKIRSSDSRSVHSCGSCEFRAPPRNLDYPTTVRKEQSISSYPSSEYDHQQKASTLYTNSDKKPIDIPLFAGSDVFLGKNRISSNGYVGVGGRLQGKGVVRKKDVVCSDGFLENKWVLGDEFSKDDGICISEFTPRGSESFKMEEQVDDEEDGVSNCSSSDLFELKSYEPMGDLSRGLPVFATTGMEAIKRGPSITRVAF